MSYAGYMIDISNPEGWDYTGTAVIPESEHHLPRATAFYVGGNTPHIWTKEQIIRSSNEYRLPIWVYDPAQSSIDDGKRNAAEFADALKAIGVPKGSVAALDMETYVNGPYSQAFHEEIVDQGYLYVVYESEGIAGNYVGDLGRWYALWDNDKSLDSFAHQYANDGMLGHPFDISVVASFDHFWNIKKTSEPPAPVVREPIDPPPPAPIVNVPRVVGATIDLLYSDGVTQKLTASAPGLKAAAPISATTSSISTSPVDFKYFPDPSNLENPPPSP